MSRSKIFSEILIAVGTLISFENQECCGVENFGFYSAEHTICTQHPLSRDTA